MICLNEHWTKIKQLNKPPFQSDLPLRDSEQCEITFNNQVIDLIREYLNDQRTDNLQTRLSDSRVSVYQGTMSRKYLKKVKGNTFKALILDSFLKQMNLNQETFDNVINLIMKIKEET